LRGWQSLGGFLDFHQVLLITHSWLPKLLHYYHHLTLPMLPLLKALSYAILRNFL